MTDKKIAPAIKEVFESEEISLTEILAAERFVYETNGDCLYNISTKMWHVWNGKCWEVDDRNIVKNRARSFVKTLFNFAGNYDRKDLDEYLKNTKRLNSNTGISNILSLASIELTKKSEDFDTNIHLLNLQNGTLEFTDGGFIFREHRKSDMCSFIGNASYNPSEPIPDIWLKHIETISDGDNELADNIQTIMGYTLDGGNPHEHMLIVHGGGRNGKSVTFRFLMHVLGNYAITVHPLTLMEHGNKTVSPERILLRGKRLIIAQEPNKPEEGSHQKDTSTLDTGFIKAATGGDEIPARELYSNRIERFKVIGLITFITNPLPKVNDTSVAFWERLITIPLGHIIPHWERNPKIETEFIEGSSGILNWLIEGLMKSKAGRFELCKTIKEDINHYRGITDIYAPFIGACVVDSPNTNTKANDLYNAYFEYQKRHGMPSNNPTQFGIDMAKRFNKKRDLAGNYFCNIKIQTEQTTVV